MRGFVLQLATADMQTIASADIMLGADVTVHEVRASEFSDSGFWRSLADLHDAARQGWPGSGPGREARRRTASRERCAPC